MKKEVITKEEKKNETSAGMITPETGKETPATINTESATETETPDKIYYNNIEVLTDEFIQNEYNDRTKEELKNDRGFFPRLIQYLYNNYIGDLLKNKIEYKLQKIKPVYTDIKQLDHIFDIYTDLVYRYKWNNRPSILEFSLLIGISRNTIYQWLKGDIDKDIINSYRDDDRRKHITIEYKDTVEKWQQVSERALVDGNGELVKEIFLLKSVHGFRDQNNDINITVNHKAIIDADNLPDLIGINSKD